MNNDDLAKISEQLDQLISLVAMNITKGVKPTEAIRVLGSAGVDRNLIAQITCSTPQTVSVRLSEAKAKMKSPKNKDSKRKAKKK